MKGILFKMVFVTLVSMVSLGSGQLSGQISTQAELGEYIQRYFMDRGALERKYTVIYSDEYFDRMEKLASEWKNRLQKLEYNALNTSGKVDYHLLKSHLERRISKLNEDRKQWESVSEVVDFADPLYDFIRNRRRGNDPNSREVAEDFNSAMEKINQKREVLSEKEGFSSWQKAALAVEIVKDLQQSLEWSFDFYHQYHPEFSWWVEKPFEDLSYTLTEYMDFLRENYEDPVNVDGSGIFGRPLGREALEEEIKSEMIPYSPEELIDLAWQEFKWCQDQLNRSAATLGFEGDYMAAIEHVKNSWVEPGEQPELINYLAEEAIEFLEERDLLTIPPLAKESWRMRMLSPEMQRFAPFFLGGEQVQVAFPTSTMEHDLKMMSLRGNNPHFSRAVVHHELIPGHHLQQFMNNRYNVQRRYFRTPFWIEGWALYWEMLLWDLGFARDAKDEIGMLFWRIHRCARIIFSLKFHLGEMTPQECIDFLVDKVGHERANAEAEVRRSFEGNYGPLYQISYMIGGLQLYALRNEVLDAGIMSEKEFHDRILRENTMPIELLRALLTDNPPAEEHQSQWHFIKSLN